MTSNGQGPRYGQAAEATENGAGQASATGRSLIFDIPIDLAQPADMLRRITSWVGRTDAPRGVMYVNAHVLNRSREDPALRRALECADLIYCDGYGGRLAAKALDVQTPP